MLHSSSHSRLTKELAKKDPQTPVNCARKMAAGLSQSQGRVAPSCGKQAFAPAPPTLQISPEDPFSTEPTMLSAKSCRWRLNSIKASISFPPPFPLRPRLK